MGKARTRAKTKVPKVPAIDELNADIGSHILASNSPFEVMLVTITNFLTISCDAIAYFAIILFATSSSLNHLLNTEKTNFFFLETIGDDLESRRYKEQFHISSGILGGSVSTPPEKAYKSTYFAAYHSAAI